MTHFSVVSAGGLFVLINCVLNLNAAEIGIDLVSVGCFGKCPTYFGHPCEPFDDCCKSSVLINGTEHAGKDGVSIVALNASSGQVIQSFLLRYTSRRALRRIPVGSIVVAVSQYSCDGDLEGYYDILDRYLKFGLSRPKNLRVDDSMLAVKCKGKCPPGFLLSTQVLRTARKGFLKYNFKLSLKDVSKDCSNCGTETPQPVISNSTVGLGPDSNRRNERSNASSTIIAAVICSLLFLAFCILLVIFRKKLIRTVRIKMQLPSKRNKNIYANTEDISSQPKQETYMCLQPECATKPAQYEPLCNTVNYENMDNSNGNIYSSVEDQDCQLTAGRSAMLFSKFQDNGPTQGDKFASYVVSVDKSGLYKAPSNVLRREPPKSPAPQLTPDRDSYVSMHGHEYDEPSVSLQEPSKLTALADQEYVSLNSGSGQ